MTKLCNRILSVVGNSVNDVVATKFLVYVQSKNLLVNYGVIALYTNFPLILLKFFTIFPAIINNSMRNVLTFYPE